MEVVKANGGASVHVIPPQSYSTLQKGIIDVGFFTFTQVMHYNLTEVCDFFYAQDFGGGCILLMMNLDSWNAMSPKDQKIMEDSMYDLVVPATETGLKDDITGKQLIKDAGLAITYPTLAEQMLWEQDSGPAIDKWVAGCKEAGIDNPMPLLEKWKEIRKKYQKMIK